MSLFYQKVKNTLKKAVQYQHFLSIEPIKLFSLKKVCKFVFVLLLIIYSSTVFPKKPDDNKLPLLKGVVFNLEDITPVIKALVTNQRTKVTVSANLEGQFEISALNTDSLEVSSLGFCKQIVPIPSGFNNSNMLIIYARPLRFLLPDVNVNGNYQKPNFKVEKIEVSPYFRDEIMREKPAQEKAFQNQISFLKIPLGRKEQPEQKTREAIKDEKQWAAVSKIYNKELVRMLTGLNNTEADNFMMYLNSKRLFNKTNTKEYASYIILEQFKLYRKEGH